MALNKIDTQVAEKLRRDGLIDPFQHQSILDYLADHPVRFYQAVIELGYLSEDKMMQIVSRITGFPLASLDKMRPDPLASARLPAAFCREHLVFPCSLREQTRTLWLAMVDPTDINIRNEARRLSGLEIKPLLAGPDEILRHIASAYPEMAPRLGGDFAPDIDLSLEPGEEEEFKITDIAGRTLIKHLGDIKPSPPPPDREKLRLRLEQLLGYQRKAGQIIDTLVDLLTQKGWLSLDDLRRSR
jgi:hypothetical protein